MNNTDALAEQAMKFQNLRRVENECYREKLKSIEKYKGSEYYIQEQNNIRNEHNAIITSLKNEYGTCMRELLKRMRESVNKRSMKPVSAEQYNTLQTLRMKQSLTEDDIQRVANLCKDNPTAISVLSEIAQAAGMRHIVPSSYGIELSNTQAISYIEGLEHGINDLLEYDSSYIARTLNNRKKHNGGVPVPDDELPFRELVHNAKEFYSEHSSIPSDMMNSFSEAVNGAKKLLIIYPESDWLEET